MKKLTANVLDCIDNSEKSDTHNMIVPILCLKPSRFSQAIKR